jgi:hypothetical protein
MERLDALAVRESNGKSYFTKIGAAFPNKDGKGYSILLDAIPAPADGQFKIMLREPLPKDGAQRDQQHRANLGNGPKASGYADLDDEIPPF